MSNGGVVEKSGADPLDIGVDKPTITEYYYCMRFHRSIAIGYSIYAQTRDPKQSFNRSRQSPTNITVTRHGFIAARLFDP